MPVGRNQAFLCLSFASHEGRRWVRVNGHILALSYRGQADKALILYCQAVLLTFFKIIWFVFNIVIFSWLLYYSYGYYYYYSSYYCSEPQSLVLFSLLADVTFISASCWFLVLFVGFFFIILATGERCCSTPVQFLHCSLPLTGLSPQQGSAVQLFLSFISKRRTNTTWTFLYSFNNNKPYMFLDNPVCLSVPR